MAQDIATLKNEEKKGREEEGKRKRKRQKGKIAIGIIPVSYISHIH